jgi:hypothetical protein
MHLTSLFYMQIRTLNVGYGPIYHDCEVEAPFQPFRIPYYSALFPIRNLILEA